MLYHPVTTEYEDNHRNFEQVLDAFNNIKIKRKYLWPNADAGGDKISRILRVKRENNLLKDVKFLKTFQLSCIFHLYIGQNV